MTKTLSSRIGKTALVLGSATALAVGAATSASAAAPQPLPAKAGSFQTAFRPHFDYDSDSCFPSAAIGPDGKINGGLKISGSLTGGCRHPNAGNTYSRSKCNHNWCGIVYALYFEKDQADPTGASAFAGHRHDWECVVAWVKRGANKPSYLSASRHGGFSTHPVNEVPMDGSHVEIVYHKDGGGTHAFRFAKWGERPEAFGKWDTPALVQWDQMDNGLRTKLAGAKWLDDDGTEHANLPVKDGNFQSSLAKAKPSGIPFDPNGAWE